MGGKFDFYEVVRLKSHIDIPKWLHGSEGTILGKSQNDDGSWGYAVAVEVDNNMCWNFSEDKLEWTGKMKNKEDFYDGVSIKIKVDPETGNGFIDGKDH